MSLFDEDTFRARAAARLHAAAPARHAFSDDDLNPTARMIPADEAPKPAAVLVGLVPRAGGLTLLLTERQPHLRRHAGQIAFPGGRIDATDADAVAAAGVVEDGWFGVWSSGRFYPMQKAAEIGLAS